MKQIEANAKIMQMQILDMSHGTDHNRSHWWMLIQMLMYISDVNANIADNADADMDASEDTDTDVTDCWFSWQCLCDDTFDACDACDACDADADIANIADAGFTDAGIADADIVDVDISDAN